MGGPTELLEVTLVNHLQVGKFFGGEPRGYLVAGTTSAVTKLRCEQVNL